jgi:hypothetical protein
LNKALSRVRGLKAKQANASEGVEEVIRPLERSRFPCRDAQRKPTPGFRWEITIRLEEEGVRLK